MKAWLAGPMLLALAGCDPNGNAGLMANSAMDELRGAPRGAALETTAHFEGAGIAFDYPAVLRMRHEVDEDGDSEWNFEYGMYTLEVYAPKAQVTAANYLGALEALFSGGGVADLAPAAAGEPVTLCGTVRTPAVARVKLMGEVSAMEAFDLPAPPGEARLLIFDDELAGGQPTALALATRERVLATLRCETGR